MLIRHDRLPATMIISIRDMTFLPVGRRGDMLWLTALPDYARMAARLGIEPHPWLETRPARRWLGLLSLATMWDHALRRLDAPTLPGPVPGVSLPTMEVLQADGAIRWSEAHLAQFTPARMQAEVERAVAARQGLDLAIDPAAVTAVDRLLGLLTERGVRIVLIHPPFNPAFYREIEHTPYGDGLRRVAALTRRLAAAHGAIVVGSFDPAVAGCTEAMYIDAEHSSPPCLARVLHQVPGL
jgi:hypothetical protein